MEERISVILIRPQTEPMKLIVPNRLEVFQSLVGGRIEGIGLSPTAHMFVNETGKIIGLEPNRRFGNDILVGNIVIVGTKDSDIVTLTPEQIEQYMEQFKTPEVISTEEVRAAMNWGYTIF